MLSPVVPPLQLGMSLPLPTTHSAGSAFTVMGSPTVEGNVAVLGHEHPSRAPSPPLGNRYAGTGTVLGAISPRAGGVSLAAAASACMSPRMGVDASTPAFVRDLSPRGVHRSQVPVAHTPAPPGAPPFTLGREAQAMVQPPVVPIQQFAWGSPCKQSQAGIGGHQPQPAVTQSRRRVVSPNTMTPSAAPVVTARAATPTMMRVGALSPQASCATPAQFAVSSTARPRSVSPSFSKRSASPTSRQYVVSLDVGSCQPPWPIKLAHAPPLSTPRAHSPASSTPQIPIVSNRRVWPQPVPHASLSASQGHVLPVALSPRGSVASVPRQRLPRHPQHGAASCSSSTPAQPSANTTSTMARQLRRGAGSSPFAVRPPPQSSTNCSNGAGRPPAHERAERAGTHMPDSQASAATVQDNADVLFELFTAALSEPGIADASCRRLLAEFLGADVMVHWRDLQRLDPVQTLARAVADASIGTGRVLRKPVPCSGEHDFRVWWWAFLSRHGLYGNGDAIGAEEFGELIVSAFRTLRDCFATEAYLRNLKTVRRDTQRLKDRYVDFEFISRGSLGKSYRCRSRLTREECICRQIRKDRIVAPADQVRSEIELLRNIEHTNLPQIVESFEDFNSAYIVVETIDGIELVNFLQQQHAGAKQISEAWLATVMRQILEALRHCHELRPHTIVHGDLRLESILLASDADVTAAPHVVVADLALAGLLPLPPPRARHHRTATRSDSFVGVAVSELAEPPSPKRDVWSCGCMLYIFLTGVHPFDNDDIGGHLLPSLAGPSRGWHRGHDGEANATQEVDLFAAGHGALRHVSAGAASLCSSMLAHDVEERPSAAECLRHPWLSALKSPQSGERLIPLEALGSFVNLYAKAMFRQVVTNLIVSELSSGPLVCLGSILNAMDVLKLPEKGYCTAATATAELVRWGVSQQSVEKVLRAFGPDGSDNISYGRFAAGCAELAEDRLDHALWRVFTAVGEEHRGVLGAAELERILDGGSNSGDRNVMDWAGGAEHYIRGALDPELTASAIVRLIAKGGTEVTFEALKDFVVRRQSTAANARSANASIAKTAATGDAGAATSTEISGRGAAGNPQGCEVAGGSVA